MNSNKNLVFLGMMGSGKSSIGAMVSKKLNIPFIDIDNLIEEHTGMTVSEIFEVNGEDYFRNLEEKITIKSLKNKKVVVSLSSYVFIIVLTISLFVNLLQFILKLAFEYIFFLLLIMALISCSVDFEAKGLFLLPLILLIKTKSSQLSQKEK